MFGHAGSKAAPLVVPSEVEESHVAQDTEHHTTGLRVLVVLAEDEDGKTAIWATRQIAALRAMGTTVDVFPFKQRRSLRGLFKGGLDLRRQIKACAPDVVHVRYAAAQALVAVLVSNRPVLISYCGSDLLGNYDATGRKTWSGAVSTLLSQLAAMGAHRCLPVSEELKNALWLRSCRDKCAVIPNGVDLALFKPAARGEARRALGWNHDDPVVLFMDRQGAWVKDPQLAREVYQRAKRRVPSLRLCVVEREPPERMPWFINASDVLLVTSRHEGSNNTVKEALACNLPVVATTCGDVEERLRGVQASYVCSRDPEELSQRVCQVVVQGCRSNGRELMSELTMEKMAARVKQCYAEVATPHGRVLPIGERQECER